MNTTKKPVEDTPEVGKEKYKEYFAKECWMYIKTVADIVREPILILDKDLHVMSANESFYHLFQVEKADTENKFVYELGNGQWNIPALRKLLEDILPKNTFFKGFEIDHNFPFIGHKAMILNARQIHTVENGNPPLLPPIIFLAIEDVTIIMDVAETLASQVKELAKKNADQTERLETNIKELKEEISQLKKKP